MKMIIFSEAYLETINTLNETKVEKFKAPPLVFVINEDIDMPDPSLRIKPIKVEGLNFRMIFNQIMTKPLRPAQFDYSKVFRVKIVAAEDE